MLNNINKNLKNIIGKAPDFFRNIESALKITLKNVKKSARKGQKFRILGQKSSDFGTKLSGFIG